MRSTKRAYRSSSERLQRQIEISTRHDSRGCFAQHFEKQARIDAALMRNSMYRILTDWKNNAKLHSPERKAATELPFVLTDINTTEREKYRAKVKREEMGLFCPCEGQIFLMNDVKYVFGYKATLYEDGKRVPAIEFTRYVDGYRNSETHLRSGFDYFDDQKSKHGKYWTIALYKVHELAEEKKLLKYLLE